MRIQPFNSPIAYNVCAIILIVSASFSQLSAQLAGTYLMDPDSGGDYTSLTEAVDSLNSAGMSSGVTLQLQSGTYIEMVKLDSIIGNGPERQIIIESLSGNKEDVVISYILNDNDTSNYVIRLNSTQGVIIRNITFNTTEANSVYGKVIELTGFARNTIIEGNTFIGNRNSSAIVFGYEAGGADFINPNEDPIANLSVKQNLFKYFSPGVDSRYSYYVPDVYHENVVVEFNQFIDCNGIVVSQIKGLYCRNNI